MKGITHIRNFAIIAHIDHGKSTLADRLLELTGVLKPNQHDEQYLDRNPISRERGITIKLAPVTMRYKIRNPTEYILDLIDTPGHVDFSYEVDRTLACVEGVILLVDATQGIQAQTIVNAYKALEKNLVIIPAVNKIDMSNADVAGTKKQLAEFLGIYENEVFEISAKTGEGVENLLQAVIEKIPAPNFQILNPKSEVRNNVKQALIFDSYYDPHQGVVAFVRVFSGEFTKRMKVRLRAEDTYFDIQEVGIFTPSLKPVRALSFGEIGYIMTDLKDIHKVQVGDTVRDEKGESSPLPGYQKVKPMVYASIFPTDPNGYVNLKKALEKLYLTDSALDFSSIYSKAMGAGFRVGFLGLLHTDVVRERLEREFNQNLVITPPQVDYKIVNNHFFEPIVKIVIITPQEHVGAVMRLCEGHRGRFITMDNKSQIYIQYEMPLSEMIADFFDNLKSITSGYASFDWEFLRYEQVDADKLSIMLNLEEIEEFSAIVVVERAVEKARQLTQKLKDLIPRQQYEVRIQAKYKGKIIASEKISPFRKDVTRKLYGGDRTRKDKLLEKQKEGKKKLKMVGKVEIPKEAFLKLFKKS